ncbi:M23 family metallopeptidase [Acinetobacter rathckeae]|uniref:M23 family metallopeptidase n=1 Tax=Acinetobacter rathckeae TaxID=2605272 RepID=UPI0018A2F8D8|nr:M23 family metallopeptidase [Acinetobacter rathckeae]MBF7688092.1 M23 family metallopeptidase [Acinetobacter rathckeae]
MKCINFPRYLLTTLYLTTTSFTVVACSSHQKAVALPTSVVTQLKTQPLAQTLPIPVQGVTKKQLRDTWGAARSGGRTHDGIDIIAPRGTSVSSTTNGVIASLKPSTLGGIVVWIIGPAGAWHYYAHLDTLARGLHVGQQVKAGQRIGTVGNTGNAKNTVSHLHYSIYLDGQGRGAVNPYSYLYGRR